MKSKLVCGKVDWTYIMILALYKSNIFVKSEIRALEVIWKKSYMKTSMRQSEFELIILALGMPRELNTWLVHGTINPIL